MLMKAPVAKVTPQEAIQRWPRVVAHLICQSLGYFCPRSAAAAVAAAVNGEAFYCEWYGSVCDKAGKTYAEVTKRMLAVAIQHRRYHKGYMADFETALGLVLVEREHVGATAGMLAAWF